MNRGILNTLYKLAVAISVLSGVILLPIRISTLSGSIIIGWAAGLTLVLMLFGGVLYHTATPGYRRRAGLKRTAAHPILAKESEKVILRQTDNKHRE